MIKQILFRILFGIVCKLIINMLHNATFAHIAQYWQYIANIAHFAQPIGVLLKPYC